MESQGHLSTDPLRKVSTFLPDDRIWMVANDRRRLCRYVAVGLRYLNVQLPVYGDYDPRASTTASRGTSKVRPPMAIRGSPNP